MNIEITNKYDMAETRVTFESPLSFDRHDSL